MKGAHPRGPRGSIIEASNGAYWDVEVEVPGMFSSACVLFAFMG